jgi:hypothetical protein
MLTGFMKIIGYLFFLSFAIPFLPVALGVYGILYHDLPDIDTSEPAVGVGYIAFLFALSVLWLAFLIQVANSFSGM